MTKHKPITDEELAVIEERCEAEPLTDDDDICAKCGDQVHIKKIAELSKKNERLQADRDRLFSALETIRTHLTGLCFCCCGDGCRNIMKEETMAAIQKSLGK